MDSSQTEKNIIVNSISSDSSAPPQDSTIFGCISDLSPIKPSKGAAQEFTGFSSFPFVLTSSQINPPHQSSSLTRPQYHEICSEYSKKNDDRYNGVSTSECIDEYFAELLEADFDNTEHVTGSSLKRCHNATSSNKDSAEYKNDNTMNSEQHNDHLKTEVSQQPGVPERCLPSDKGQLNTVAENCGSLNQADAFSSELQVLTLSCAAIYAPLNSMELQNISQPISSASYAPKNGKPSVAVSKSSGIGLHLNSIVPLSRGASATVKSAEEDYKIVDGKKSYCILDSHLTGHSAMSATTSKAVDGSSLRSEAIEPHSRASAIKPSGILLPCSPKPTHTSVLLKKPTEHNHSPCNIGKSTQLIPKKKRKRSTGVDDEDSCKRCNCKKTKCIQLYCDCFAAGVYCAETCSCQGCFNSPEYEDTVLEIRQQIESRNPLAFAPKIVQGVAEPPAIDIQNINKSTPSSARHKRGCACKKSMCLKKYCECYQSNVGCSDGCRCDGCKNVYGKKEGYGSSKHIVITEATNEASEKLVDHKLDAISRSELSTPQSSTSSFQYYDYGKHASNSRFPYGGERYFQPQESDIALVATHEKPMDSLVIMETSQTVPILMSSDQQMYNCNSKKVDNYSPRRCGNKSLSIHQNPCSMAVDCLMSQKTKVLASDTSSQPCAGSGSLHSLNSFQMCSPLITPVVPFVKNDHSKILDSDNGCYNITEDDDTPEILKENPIPFSEVKVISPNNKRISQPHSHLHQLGSSSSNTGLRSGRKFILKAVPSFPPLAPCIDVTSSSSGNTEGQNSADIK